MSTKFITYIAFFSVGIVLFMQAFLIMDYFQTVKLALTRESDAILKEAFREDMNQRNLTFKSLFDTASVQPESNQNSSKEVFLDLSKVGVQDDGLMNKFDLVMNDIVSKFVPVDIAKLDSITKRVLEKRKISTSFLVQIVNLNNNKVIEESVTDRKYSFLEIESGLLPIDSENKKALKLILVNPFSVVLKRMIEMLIGTIIFTIVSLFAIAYLIKILSQQKKLVAYKNEFLSNIAHELKRPVSSMMVNLDCLRMDEFINNVNQRNKLLNNSINSLNELYGTISMIVGLAREEEGLLVLNKQKVNLMELLDGVVDKILSTPSKTVVINRNFPVKRLLIIADNLMLTQCFANLIDNAIKYSRSEVVIDVTVKIADESVSIAFKDNGIGIPEDKINTIFEKYARVDNNAKVNGFGIGLNYVKTIIEKHGGKISVQSEPDKGSEFTVVLPDKMSL